MITTMNRSGIIPGPEYAVDQEVIDRLAVNTLLNGRTDLYTEEEIMDLIAERYLSFPSIVPISSEEESILQKNLAKTLTWFINEVIKKFLDNEWILVFSNEMIHEGLLLYLHEESESDNDNVKKLIFESRISPLTPQEKLEVMSIPRGLKIRNKERCSEGCGLAKMGYRHLDRYGIWESEKDFLDKINQICQRIGQEEIHIMDFGGGYGLALKDLKNLYPQAVTYNATRDEEISCYLPDYQVVCFLERMPEALRGKIHLIISNMSTRYLAFHDLAIQGCIEALAPGGTMNVFFSCERSDNPDGKDVKRRMKEAYEYLRDLEASGVISLSIDGRFSSNIGCSGEAEKHSLFPASNVIATKL